MILLGVFVLAFLVGTTLYGPLVGILGAFAAVIHFVAIVGAVGGNHNP